MYIASVPQAAFLAFLWLQSLESTWATPARTQGFLAIPLTKTYNLPSSQLDEPNALFANGGELAGTIQSPTADAIHSLGLDIEGDDYGYVASMLIGTPPRPFRLLVDSGSSYLWVGGEGCVMGDGSGDCSNHTLIGPQSSSTFKDTGAPFFVKYGSGPVAGHIVSDHVNFAGIDVKDLTFAVALKESRHYGLKSTLYDGILGLARLLPGQSSFPPLIDTLYEQGFIKDPIVSYKIPRRADHLDDGEVAIGAMNPAKYKAATVITLPNIGTQRFWEVSLQRVVVNGLRMTWGTRSAVLDSGSTFILGPRKDIAKVHTAIPGAQYQNGTWAVPCHTDVIISFTFGDRTFPIPARDLPFKPVDKNDPDGLCLSRIGELQGSTDSRWIVGDVFLKNIYFSTHLGKNEISIAELA
ncbi:hypothetical protein PC9H_009566 [Pleurotus ostreatus]|uniref:Peptidase A1 domain-containing protein n=1 Tax=Pleurotus ostreatus TaxID=5322 RepID=A0A8H6ZLY8_PLEOS|nr:uncharacterized protein PC9H_009566 [Pleurotus ostreatus]KAF7424260.1 hypothetical protein PC9H_009566 [Pleurotus ostreatus]KAJ8692861.1 hypothetical protein PTI98_010131 [Pleurotus ostreatus]